ncbi:hypothetical protein AXX17_AT1G34400 [Arabidopsis thaliana]|uniref:Uncharacterized protein n=1 Tax=Arabidopsis thaliana TaxID=3702 RepID=A0A178W7Q3_ARATH|nr:hypothetical protein AXX17_AT1G34400 [Arabidopsis thaliana]
MVSSLVLSSDNPKRGYNAATGKYKDLMATKIIDTTKHVSSVAKTFFLNHMNHRQLFYTKSGDFRLRLLSPQIENIVVSEEAKDTTEVFNF